MGRSLHKAREQKDGRDRWPGRGKGANRLEPECWPLLKPRFHFEPGCSVFTIGSCFARNIEAHLARAGFHVPNVLFLEQHKAELGKTGREILNKYTPPSIYQELAWTKSILDRDDRVTAEDIEPFLLELPDGNVLDVMRRNYPRAGTDRKAALAQRQSFYELFRNAFTSDIVVMTLGYVECWYDRKFDQYIEFNPRLAEHNSDNRFCFKRLDYPEAYKYIRDVVTLLNGDGAKPILLTTSPVPINRTFTGDDVIVANTYSKSVLRAVAGKIADEFPIVDYFPAYESVMLTKQPYVWEDDLVHIESAFVARVMARVIETYLPGKEAADISVANDEFLRFADLVKHKQFDDANDAFQKLRHGTFDQAPAEFLIAAAELMLHTGDRAKAKEFVDAAVTRAKQIAKAGFALLFRAATVYAELGFAAEERNCFEHVFNASQNFAREAGRYIRFGARSDTPLDAIMTFAIGKLGNDVDFLNLAARTYEQKGDSNRAQEIWNLIAATGDVSAVIRQARNLFGEGKFDLAAQLHVRALSLDGSSAARLAPWVRRYLRAGRNQEAAALAAKLQQTLPETARVAAASPPSQLQRFDAQ